MINMVHCGETEASSAWVSVCVSSLRGRPKTVQSEPDEGRTVTSEDRNGGV